jgi:hypothetical protein
VSEGIIIAIRRVAARSPGPARLAVIGPEQDSCFVCLTQNKLDSFDILSYAVVPSMEASEADLYVERPAMDSQAKTRLKSQK